MSVYIYVFTYQWIKKGETQEKMGKKGVRKCTFKLPFTLRHIHTRIPYIDEPLGL